MPQVARVKDLCTGHDAYPPRPAKTGSPNVFVNGRAIHRKLDLWEEHCMGEECHIGETIDGCETVFANGKPVARIKDRIHCFDDDPDEEYSEILSVIMTGSHNVFVEEQIANG